MKKPSVDVILRDEKYVVRVTERGSVIEEEFGGVQFAMSWASSQSIRLGLAPPQKPNFTQGFPQP